MHADVRHEAQGLKEVQQRIEIMGYATARRLVRQDPAINKWTKKQNFED